MADQTQPGTRISEKVWEAFRQDVEERHGKINGYLGNEVENALREYMNASHGGDTHDRLVEIENEVKELRALLEDIGETKKDSDVSSTTENRLQKIRERIDKETDGSPKVHNEVLELAIRQCAGSSRPTINRYKELLKQDQILFPNPANESMYFRDPADFTKAVNAMTKGGRISQREYNELVTEYGEDWWSNQIPETNGDKRGFE